MTLKLVQTRVDLAVVELTRTLANGLVQKRLRIKLRVHTKNIEDDARRCAVVTCTDDVTVADDKDQLPLVIVVQRSEGVDGTPERLFAFGVARDLAQHEFVQHLGVPFRGELKGSQDLGTTSAS